MFTIFLFSLLYFHYLFMYQKKANPEPCGYIQVELGSLINNDTSGTRCSRQ